MPGARGPASGGMTAAVLRDIPTAHKRRLAAAARGMGHPQEDDVERTRTRQPKLVDSAGPISGFMMSTFWFIVSNPAGSVGNSVYSNPGSHDQGRLRGEATHE